MGSGDWQLELVLVIGLVLSSSSADGGGSSECPFPPPPAAGARVLQPPPYLVGASVDYTCDAGFRLEGERRVRCFVGGWERPNFTCQAVACGDPGEVPNGSRLGRLWTFQRKVEYVCGEGYVMTGGSNFRYCQANMRWSGSAPTCSPINCTQPENPEHGVAIYDSLSYGSAARYECNHERAVQGGERRTCQANGQWSGVMPVCVVVDCGPPFDGYPSGYVRVFRGTHLNDIIEYRCNDGHSEPAQCVYPGHWQPPAPECMDAISAKTTTMASATAEPKKGGPFFCKWRIFRGWLC